MNRITAYVLLSFVTTISLLTNSIVALADDAAVACKASLLHPLGVPVRTSIFGSDSFSCSDLKPNGGWVSQTCAQASYPNTPNCSVTFWSDAPADSVLQCSVGGPFGPPNVLYKYVLCQALSGKYYWALLTHQDRSISLPQTFAQSKP